MHERFQLGEVELLRRTFASEGTFDLNGTLSDQPLQPAMDGVAMYAERFRQTGNIPVVIFEKLEEPPLSVGQSALNSSERLDCLIRQGWRRRREL